MDGMDKMVWRVWIRRYGCYGYEVIDGIGGYIVLLWYKKIWLYLYDRRMLGFKPPAGFA